MAQRQKSTNHVSIDSDSDSSDENSQEYDFKRKKQKLEEQNKRISITASGINNVSRTSIRNKILSAGDREKGIQTNGNHSTIIKLTSDQRKSKDCNPDELRGQRIKPPICVDLVLNGVKSEEATLDDEKVKAEVDDGIKLVLQDWKFSAEKVAVDEYITWIPPKASNTLDLRILQRWTKCGSILPPNKYVHQFCDPTLAETLFKLKSLLGKMKDSDLKSARSRSNPFDVLKNGPFLNRAAMKMANIDAVLGFALTEPKTQTGEPILAPNELLYFADVCSGPGGFTEYVLWRKKWDSKGFGFTLKGELDFKFTDFFSGPPESFEAYYGPAEDGNIYNPNNFRGFINHVLSNTEGRGVHFMMADGGFCVKGRENEQENLSQHIYLSQVLYGIGLIRAGGHFVCKMFDTFTPFTVGLLYLLYNCFDLVAVIKPITSRPANSERYIVCKWKRKKETVMPILEHLAKCHENLWDMMVKNSSNTTIIDLVPISVLKKDVEFYEYIVNSNNTICKNQIENLKTLFAYYREPKLDIGNQEDVKLKCFDQWKLPETIKKMLSVGAQPRFKTLCGSYDETFVQKTENELTLDLIKAVFKSPYDWRCVVVEGSKACSHRGFYIALGGMKNYIFRNNTWKKIELSFAMCKDTLVYGEIVGEVNGSGTVIPVFHIIDGMVLGGKDIRNLHYTQRHEMCVKFAKAIHMPRAGVVSVSVKSPIRMENIGDLMEGLKFRFIKDSVSKSSYSSLVAPTDHTDETSTVIKPAGILFLKITKDPWLMSCSRSARRKYWFNTVSGESTFDVVEGAIADFLFTMKSRVIWWWDKNMKLTAAASDSSSTGDPSIIHFHHIMEHINSVMPHRQHSTSD